MPKSIGSIVKYNGKHFVDNNKIGDDFHPMDIFHIGSIVLLVSFFSSIFSSYGYF